jgi:hypothetical protein
MPSPLTSTGSIANDLQNALTMTTNALTHNGDTSATSASTSSTTTDTVNVSSTAQQANQAVSTVTTPAMQAVSSTPSTSTASTPSAASTPAVEPAASPTSQAAAATEKITQLQTSAPETVEEPAKVSQRVQPSTLLSPWLRQSGTTKSQMTSDLYRGLRSADWAEPPKRMEATTDGSSFRWGVEMIKRGVGQVAAPSFVGESKGGGASGPRPFAVSAYDPSERAASPKKDDASINPIRWTGFGAFIRHG